MFLQPELQPNNERLPNVTNKSSTKNFKPEQKHNNEMLLIAPTFRPNNGKRFVGCWLLSRCYLPVFPPLITNRVGWNVE